MRQVSQHASNPDGKLAHEYLDALKHQRRLSPATLSNYARALDVLLPGIYDADGVHASASRLERVLVTCGVGAEERRRTWHDGAREARR